MFVLPVCVPRRLVAAAVLVLVVPAAGVTQPEFDCTARHLAYQYASTRLSGVPALAAKLHHVSDALRLAECPDDPGTTGVVAAGGAQVNAGGAPAPQPAAAPGLWVAYVSAEMGDDTNPGTVDKPFRTVQGLRHHFGPHRPHLAHLLALYYPARAPCGVLYLVVAMRMEC